MAVPVVLSPTSLKTFLTCPQKYEFRHLLYLESRPSVKATIGTSAHKAVEVNYRQKLETRVDVPEDVVVDAFSDTFDNESKMIDHPEEPLGKAKDSGVGLVKLYHTGTDAQPPVAPRIQPKWVEQSAQFRLISTHREGCDRGPTCTCGVPFSVTADLVDEEGAVHDLKTTARTPSGGAHLMQVAGGALAYEVATGDAASDLVIDYLIRTKIPKYHEERWGGPVDAQLKRVFARQVTTAYDMIQAGMFPASGVEGYACGYCEYKPICPAWKRSR